MIRLSLANWSNLLGKRGNWEFGYFRVLGGLGISGFKKKLGKGKKVCLVCAFVYLTIDF